MCTDTPTLLMIKFQSFQEGKNLCVSWPCHRRWCLLIFIIFRYYKMWYNTEEKCMGHLHICLYKSEIVASKRVYNWLNRSHANNLKFLFFQQPDSCFIDGVCYRRGDQSSTEQVCDPSLSRNDWSVVKTVKGILSLRQKLLSGGGGGRTMSRI